ncbi:hypothetical protein V6N12_048963 [Hibiscus sabdariffa]|uniref:Uncharacterized protein n=1 Tax=Hibiscus sabdariffa TaxID=183260 RepID=A0ABR2EIT3_9ROSI
MERAKRHLTSSDVYTLCNLSSVNIDIVLCGFTMAIRIWKDVMRPDRLDEFLTMSYTNWCDNIRGRVDFVRGGIVRRSVSLSFVRCHGSIVATVYWTNNICRGVIFEGIVKV